MSATLLEKLDAGSAYIRGCLIWQGGKSKGYGQVGHEGRRYLAHRIACEMEHGPAPEGKAHALHICNRPACVRPDHLYWGDNTDNARDRKKAGTATGGRVYATACVNGHEFTFENTYLEPRGRACKECRREAVRRYRRKAAAS